MSSSSACLRISYSSCRTRASRDSARRSRSAANTGWPSISATTSERAAVRAGAASTGPPVRSTGPFEHAIKAVSAAREVIKGSRILVTRTG